MSLLFEFSIGVDCLTFFVALQCRDAIVTWIKKKIGPGVSNITTVDDAERILTAESKVVLGLLNSLVVSFQMLFATWICLVIKCLCLEFNFYPLIVEMD